METIVFSPPSPRRIVASNFVRRTPEGFPAMTMFTPRSHFLYYEQEGVRVMEDDEEPFEMRPGDVILFYCGRAYPSHRPPGPYRAMNIYIEPGPADRCLAGDARPGDATGGIAIVSRIRTGRDPSVRNMFEEIVLLSHSASALKRAKGSALLGALLMELAIRSRPGHADVPGRVEYAIDLIERQLDARLDLDEVARRVGMTRRTLTRRFRETTGSSIKQYHLDARLRLAASILATNPTITLREVADTLGFYDEFHLSRSFKGRFRMSPRAFRARHSR